MYINKSKDKILKEIYDIDQLDEPVNLETKEGILPNRKLQVIYYNLLWVVEPKLPQIDGIKSLLILLDYVYNISYLRGIMEKFKVKEEFIKNINNII